METLSDRLDERLRVVRIAAYSIISILALTVVAVLWTLLAVGC